MALIHLPHVKWTLVDVTCQCHVVFIHINCKATIIPSALHFFIHWIDYYMTWSLNLFMNKIFKLNSFTWRQFFLENVEIFGKKSMAEKKTTEFWEIKREFFMNLMIQKEGMKEDVSQVACRMRHASIFSRN